MVILVVDKDCVLSLFSETTLNIRNTITVTVIVEVGTKAIFVCAGCIAIISSSHQIDIG